MLNEVSLSEWSAHVSTTSRSLPWSVAASVEGAAGAISWTCTLVQAVKPEVSSPLSAAMR